MRLCFLISNLSGGGAERVVVNLASYLKRTYDYDIEIVTIGDAKEKYPIEKNICITPLKKDNDSQNKMISSILRIKRFVKYIANNDIQVYISMLPVCNILILFFSFLTNAQIICSERNYPWRYSKIKKCLLRKLARRADAWVFQTEENSLFYNLDSTKKNIIPNAVNASTLCTNQMLCQVENIIVAAGRLTRQKNFSLLIKAFSIVKKVIPNSHLYIYGSGDEKEKLEREIDKLQLNKFVHLKGFVKDLKMRIANANVFALSSEYEGIPNVLIEAMAMGKACVATDCLGGGAKLLINDRVNGLLVDRNDVDAMANAIITLLTDDFLRRRIENNAEKIREEYAENIIYEKWNSLITSMHSIKTIS